MDDKNSEHAMDDDDEARDSQHCEHTTTMTKPGIPDCEELHFKNMDGNVQTDRMSNKQNVGGR